MDNVNDTHSITESSIPLEIPIKHFSTHLDRDKYILERYKEGMRLKDIAIEFDLSEVRISQIVKENNALIEIDIKMEKLRRYRRLKQCELKGSKMIAPKDTDQLVRVIEAQRKELEGDNDSHSINNNIQVNIDVNGPQLNLWSLTRSLLGQ